MIDNKRYSSKTNHHFRSYSVMFRQPKRHFDPPQAALQPTQSGTLAHLKRHFSPPKAAL